MKKAAKVFELKVGWRDLRITALHILFMATCNLMAWCGCLTATQLWLQRCFLLSALICVNQLNDKHSETSVVDEVVKMPFMWLLCDVMWGVMPYYFLHEKWCHTTSCMRSDVILLPQRHKRNEITSYHASTHIGSTYSTSLSHLEEPSNRKGKMEFLSSEQLLARFTRSRH